MADNQLQVDIDDTSEAVALPANRAMFARLEVWSDVDARGAAEQMATDEALLSLVRDPVMRVYRWERPAVTFGYFQQWDEVEPMLAGRDVCRRWTGGGIVEHGEDLTYALVVPAGAWTASLDGVRAWYRTVHTALMEALAESGVPGTSLADPEGPATRGGTCFKSPSAADVLGCGEKVAGAALRRTKLGVLWQGSVRLADRLREEVIEAFATRLAATVRPVAEPEGLIGARDQVLRKYAVPGWNVRR